MTYPCFPGVLLTSTPYNILSKPGLPSYVTISEKTKWTAVRGNESYRNDYHQSAKAILAEPGIEPAIPVFKSCTLLTELWAGQKNQSYLSDVQRDYAAPNDKLLALSKQAGFFKKETRRGQLHYL